MNTLGIQFIMSDHDKENKTQTTDYGRPASPISNIVPIGQISCGEFW